MVATVQSTGICQKCQSRYLYFYIDYIRIDSIKRVELCKKHRKELMNIIDTFCLAPVTLPKQPFTIGHLNSAISAVQTSGITIKPSRVKFLLKCNKYSEIIEVGDIMLTNLRRQNGFNFPKGALFEVSFDSFLSHE